ncbi:15115_t:CDS:10, partial [Dentiscutata heterogama]
TIKTGQLILMDERLIELLEDLSDSQNDDRILNIMLKRCMKAPMSELKMFFEELSQVLHRSPKVYLPTLQNLIFHFFNNSPRTILLLDLQLLWCACLTDNKRNNEYVFVLETTKRVFSAILNEEGAMEVLISEVHGRRCLKRMLFDLNILNQLDRKELLRAVDLVVSLVEKCSEHEDVSSQLSDGFSTYKACAALLETLKSYQNSKHTPLISDNSLPPMLQDMVKIIRDVDEEKPRTQHLTKNKMISLSVQDEQYFALLKMAVPHKLSDLPNILRALEQRKIDLFQDLFGFLPCTNCHERALICFLPDKYSSLNEERESSDNQKISLSQERHFRLPFEFDKNDKLGPWDIVLSENSIKDMRKLKSPHTIRAVMNKLGQISSGEWEKHDLRHKISSHIVPVYKVEIPNSDGLIILWQVDSGFSIRSCSLTQHVKIWAVTNNQEQICDTLKNLKIIHQIYTDEHNYRCVTQEVGSIILPKNFDDEEGTKSSDGVLYDLDMDNERMLDIHKMLVTNKFIPLSTNLYKSLVMGGSDFTFQVSKIEYEIINNPTSAIVIGRSGTGKTTCIVFRQVASYLANQLYKTPSSHDIQTNSSKRQIFITASYILCRRIKEYFNSLLESAALAKKKISRSEFNEYAKKKEEEGSGIDVIDNMLLEEGDEELDLGGIPNSFRQLKDHHFPLFITYNKFSQMLQGTYGIDSQKLITQSKAYADDYKEKEDDDDELNSKSSSVNKLNLLRKNFVDYKSFHTNYWPHFSDHYKKNLDCELVFSEFSVIKGTNPEVDCLSREDYRAISIKKYPTFCHNRDGIYDLFQQYEKMKARRGDYDSIDRTLAILNCVKTKGTKPLGNLQVHEVYIDECQDNHIVDFALILKLFERADNVFMAGDIAQCIARGSSFRFQDLRCLMHKWENNRIRANYDQRVTINPRQFELNVNYRSHSGILRLASSVTDLIRKYFPDSLDHLSRERGEIGGPRPIIFNGFQADTFLFDVFSVGKNVDNYIEFGAEQVIIVRDDDTKKKVKEQIKGGGLVMTVFEAKGMEFSDVLLYNFFTDSPAGLKWRVIEGSRNFSHENHYILCSELKHLYVAVTRARQHIWIFDENNEVSYPIRTYWESQGLVKVVRSKEEISTLPTLAKKSNSHAWNKRGKEFFEQKQFDQAVLCFEKSGNEPHRKLANAWLLHQCAEDSINDSDKDTIKSLFIRAALAFKDCSKPVQAATCYRNIEMYKEAGDIYREWNMYTEAVIAYKDGGCYKTVIDLLQKHKSEIDEKIFYRITRLVNIHYRRENNKVMSKKALDILPKQEQIELLRDHAPEELLEVCEKNGEFRVAAKDLRLRGKFKEAADLFITSGSEEDVMEALQCLLHLCRTNILNKTMMDISSSSTIQDLLLKINRYVTKTKSQSLISSEPWKKLMKEFSLYESYLNADLDKIGECAQFFRMCGELVAEFRAINIWLHIHQKMYIQADFWRERLLYLLRLCELAFSFIAPYRSRRNAENKEKIHKNFEDIFFVNEVENRPRERKISSDSPLICFISNMSKMKVDNDVEGVSEITDDRHVYDVEFVHLKISQFLASYIYELIWNIYRDGKNIPEIGSRICPRFTSCQKQNCRNHHVIPTPAILHERVSLACLQYIVMRKLDVLYCRRLLKDGQSKEIRGPQRRWTENLVTYHIRYQSPQTSCPEITYMVLNKLPRYTRYGFSNLAKIWLDDCICNFKVMLKCMFVYQQQRDYFGIQEFYRKMSRIEQLSHPENLPHGFEYHGGYYQAIPVGRRLSKFFHYLRRDYIVDAILEIKEFIRYTINNADYVHMDTHEAFADLASLIEFSTSLVFAIGPGQCDFCLPRSYLINYFNAFRVDPLFPSKYNNYNKTEYLDALRNSFNQAEHLLSLLIYSGKSYQIIVLRLIRLLVLIGLNEPALKPMIFDLFRRLNNQSQKFQNQFMDFKKYVVEREIGRLVGIIKNDLRETGCDSLIIVYYNSGGMSKFSGLENFGITKLTYNSIEGFRSSLYKIMSPVVAEKRFTTSFSTKELLPRRSDGGMQNLIPIFSTSVDNEEGDDTSAENEDNEDKEQLISTRFYQILDSPEAQKAIKKIKDWLSRILDRQKSRHLGCDHILDKAYSDMQLFCQNASHWDPILKEKGKKKVLRIYKILLRGHSVDMIVKLIKLQGKMDSIKDKLQKSVNNFSDDDKIENCLELLDELKYIHYENVKLSLEALSTENIVKHEEANIGWLKNELLQAECFIDQVSEWIDKCKFVMKSG